MFVSPEKIIHEFGIMSGQRVVDIGSGSGHYVFPIAKLVGATGHVYAVDISEPALHRLKKEAEERRLENVDVILADVEAEGIHLASDLVDTALLSNILSQLEDVTAVVREAKRILRSGGTLVVVDWADKLSADDVKSFIEKEDLTFLRKFEAGEQHFGMIFRK